MSYEGIKQNPEIQNYGNAVKDEDLDVLQQSGYL